MTDRQMLCLFIAALLMGAYRSLSGEYRQWKVRRSSLTYYERNSGFLTDRKLVWFERSVAWPWWLFVATTVAGAVWVVSNVLWLSYWPSN